MARMDKEDALWLLAEAVFGGFRIASDDERRELLTRYREDFAPEPVDPEDGGTDDPVRDYLRAQGEQEEVRSIAKRKR